VLKPEVLNLNDLTGNLKELLRSLLGERIALRVELAPVLPDVDVDPAQLERVLVNLVLNARDAMPGGGELELQTEHIAPGRYVVGLPPGAWVALSVSDTGCGMDAATQARLFQPFFTTKAPGEGTGLGLSTAYGIMKQSGGHLVVESAPGRGSRFTLYLPEARGQRAEVAAATSMTAGAAATETVLLVEDNDDLRELLGSELSAMGYRVLEATDGQKALQVCEVHSGPIHLVVTDVVMRGIGGVELTKALRSQRPAVPILYMSGHPERSFSALAELVTAQNFIQKPFSIDALLGKVRENLAGPRC
jgi:CheY-like chemotaxis protein